MVYIIPCEICSVYAIVSQRGRYRPQGGDKTFKDNSRQSKRGRWALARYAKGGDRLEKVEKRWYMRTIFRIGRVNFADPLLFCYIELVSALCLVN